MPVEDSVSEHENESKREADLLVCFVFFMSLRQDQLDGQRSRARVWTSCCSNRQKMKCKYWHDCAHREEGADAAMGRTCCCSTGIHTHKAQRGSCAASYTHTSGKRPKQTLSHLLHQLTWSSSCSLPHPTLPLASAYPASSSFSCAFGPAKAGRW